MNDEYELTMPDADAELSSLDDQLDTDAGTVRATDPPCSFECGVAGTGKTFSVRQRILADPSWGLLTATTGIAAVNLGAVTLNSTLKYFDTASLRDAYLNGSLVRVLHGLAREYRNLVIDEVSMMDAAQLDLIYRALQEANGYKDVAEPMGIVLVGDFAQLPPIKSRWAFEANCWSNFAAHTNKLTKIWRQDQQEFLVALNAARRGAGGEAAERLTAAGVEWQTSLDVEYDGTTIIPKNDAVDRYNLVALDRVRGKVIAVRSRRWGKQRGEWKGIPEQVEFKEGAYVMILANAPCEDGQFEYVNGDCGHIEGYEGGAFAIKLVRNGETVRVARLVRHVEHKEKPEGWYGETRRKEEDDGGYYSRSHYGPRRRKYVDGQVEYYPLRLAYASTVHKSQGLSLDRAQIDFRNHFFGNPAMMYVALSRCRSLEGLRLVGMKEVFAGRCSVDPKVREWL
jgi:ATP-dependent exoDNAse (exonuclease V) alpha subunit